MYLPQFHPVPENDEWWGKGFTEWTNVTKAKPLFKGHYQPHLPTDMGFYDLRVPETREEQAKLAKAHGIYGFCYYHYWFNGRRILERPFQEVFESGKPDFPFMLCWANENWTRTWDGLDREVLMAQHFSEEDDRRHIQTLIPYFKDDRYIKVNNKPVIAIYRTGILPDARRTVEVWREEAAKAGLELYICRFETILNLGEQYMDMAGFDASIDFQPFGHYYKEYSEIHHASVKARPIVQKVQSRAQFKIAKATDKKKYRLMQELLSRVWDYEKYVDYVITQPLPSYACFPGITPSWDNWARKKNGFFIFKNASPQHYRRWLNHIVANYKPRSEQENFIFINAWNEWAEGNHLEPCVKWGRQYLEHTKAALELYKNG